MSNAQIASGDYIQIPANADAMQPLVHVTDVRVDTDWRGRPTGTITVTGTTTSTVSSSTGSWTLAAHNANS
jgi:hypothetical protein